MKIVKSNSIEKKEKIEPFIFIKSGLSPKQANPVSFFMENHFPYIKVGTLNDNNKIIKKNNFFSNSNKNKINNAVIFPKRGAAIFTNKVAIIKEDSFIDTNLMAISSEKINLDYLYYYLKWYKLSRIADTGAIPQLNNKHINNLKIPILKKEEQEKIAQVLSQQEEQVNNIQKLIEKLEKRNQYYAERLLSGELRVREDEEGNVEFYENEEWKEVDFNLKKKNIPIDWEVDKINNIIKTQKGSSVKSEDFNHEGKGLQYLRTNEIWEDSSKNKEPVFFNGSLNNIITKNKSEYIVCFDGYNNKPFEGTLGMVTNNGVGICSGELHKILNIKNVSEYYVNVMLLKNYRFQEIICRYAEGSSVQHAGKHFKKIDEVLIPIKDQLILNKIFKEQFEEIDKLKLLKEKEQKRFEWLSDALLSGEYQIVD